MLKHLTLSSGCVCKSNNECYICTGQKSSGEFLSFLSPPPPPNRSVLRVCSVFRLRCARDAPSRSSQPDRPGMEPVSRGSVLHHPSVQLQRFLSGGCGTNIIFPLILVKKNAQENSANTKEPNKERPGKKKRNKSRLVFFSSSGACVLKKKTRVSFLRKQEMQPRQQASPFTRVFFPPYRDAHPLPQPLVLLQPLLSLLLRFHHHTLSPPPLPDKPFCAFWLMSP